MGDQPVARPLPTHRTTQAQNKRTKTSMPRAVFEPTITLFEPAKMVHALDRVATVIGFSATNVLGIMQVSTKITFSQFIADSLSLSLSITYNVIVSFQS
jgi:hypothetical protein